MIADDHSSFRRVLRDFVPGAHAVVECADGTEVVSRFAEERPDCVLMDVEMPGLDGIAATRIIRRQFPTACVIIVTQHDDPDARLAASQAGAVAFVPKERLFELNTCLAAFVPDFVVSSATGNQFP